MAKAMATVHNPTNFEPSDYEVDNYLDNQRPLYCGGPVEGYVQEVQWWEADMLRTFGANWRALIHRCVHCGNGSVRWITAVRHIPTGEVVVFGSDCTDRLGFANKVAFKLALLQSRAEARKVAFKAFQARQKFLADNPAVAEALANIEKPEHAKNYFAKDVLAKLDKYGSISEKQVSSLIASLARDIEFAAKKAAEATEEKGDAPTGRATVTGEVLSIKSQEGYMPGSTTLKMLVKLENNSKVWTTVPMNGDDIHKGDRITFKATFEPSRDDKSFGFGKRPMLVAKL